MEGWIKLYRAALDHWVFKDREAWQIWCYCLMDATHTKTQRKVKGRIVELYPGQTVFGRKEWSKLLNIDATKVYRTVQAFADAGMVQLFTVKGQYSVLTISNWHEYQGERVNSKRTAQEQENEQAETAENKALKDIPEQQNEQQMNSKRTHNKNVKNDKKKDNTYTAPESEILDFWNSKGIIVHEGTAELKGAIKKAIGKYGKDKILEGIDNYSRIHEASKNSGYWYSHKWRLDKFLKQGNGVPDFLDDGQQNINYLTHTKSSGNRKCQGTGNGRMTNTDNFEQRQHDDSYYDNFFSNTAKDSTG